MDFSAFLRIMNCSADGIFIFDAEMTLIYANKTALDQNLTTAEDILGHHWMELRRNNYIFGSFIPIAFTEKRVVYGKTIGPRGIARYITCTPCFDDAGDIEYVISNIRELDNLINNVEKLNIPLGEIDLITKDGTVGENNFCMTNGVHSKKIINFINRMAATNATVLILGETGTGKSEIARLIHNYSNRSACPYVVVNCGAIPENLLESSFFGYEKGAFTGATSTRPGYFEVTNTGTLLLDEIGELSLSMQVKLLRVLQEKKFHRVGGTKDISINVRILAATNKDLGRMVAEGTFRSDLYYRLNIIQLTVPPLRQRRSELPELINYFIAYYNKVYSTSSTFSQELIDKLIDMPWYGNIRELDNMIERLILLCPVQVVTSKWMPESDIISCMPQNGANVVPLKQAVEQTERRLLTEAREQYKDTRSMAKVLGVSHVTVSRKLKQYQIT